MSRDARQIVITLAPGPPSPSGTVATAGEPDQPFSGWLDLLSVLGLAFDRHGDGAEAKAPSMTPTEPAET